MRADGAVTVPAIVGGIGAHPDAVAIGTLAPEPADRGIAR